MSIDVAEFEDYEALPTHSLWIHMVAGAAAGIMEHCTMYPIDVVKTRMQSVLSECPESSLHSPVAGLRQIIRREGVGKVVRGVQAVVAGAVPAHALYFTVYEKLKLFLTSPDRQPGVFANLFQQHNWLAHGLAGVAATVAHDAVMNPAEVVKQRMQMFCCPYNSTWECARCIGQAEGFRAFYRSYGVQLLMNIPFHSSHFVIYELCQGQMNAAKKYNPLSHAVSGAVAGGIAAAITTPLDVCKTVLNTQEGLYRTMITNAASISSNSKSLRPDPLNNLVPSMRTTHSFSTNHRPLRDGQVKTVTVIRGLGQAYKLVLSTKGWTGLFSGIQARVLFQMPGTAIAWSVYELFKFILNKTEMSD